MRFVIQWFLFFQPGSWSLSLSLSEHELPRSTVEYVFAAAALVSLWTEFCTSTIRLHGFSFRPAESNKSLGHHCTIPPRISRTRTVKRWKGRWPACWLNRYLLSINYLLACHLRQLSMITQNQRQERKERKNKSYAGIECHSFGWARSPCMWQWEL